VYDEASIVLYEGSTFIMECAGQRVASSPIFRTDRTSRKTYGMTGAMGSNIHSYQAVKKVKQWKVLVDGHQKSSVLCPTASLVYFCRAICDVLKSQRVEIIPRGSDTGLDYVSNDFLWPNDRKDYETVDILQPLRVLRNVSKLEFGAVTGDDIPIYQNLWLRPFEPIAPYPLEPELEVELKTLVEGNSAVVHVWKMFERLVTYAQTFERNHIFKAEMKPAYGAARESSARETLESFVDSRSVLSPFKQGQVIHFVENMLEHASIESDVYHLEEFKATREKVLGFLEPQYQRVLVAAAEMAEYVNLAKRSMGLFDAEQDPPIPSLELDESAQLAEAYVVLRDYAGAMSRDLTRETKIQTVMHPRKWHLAYAMLPREKMMAEMSQILENGPPFERTTFDSLFKACVDDVDSQFLSIRMARKAMFQDDPKCTTKIMNMSLEDWAQPWRCDEHIDWTINEPFIRPATKPS
jgi:hypothetical protein